MNLDSRPAVPVALTIAGSDPSGGAGLQADLKTFHQHRVYGTSVVTLVTVQSTLSVARVELLAADLVAAQLDHLVADVSPQAYKTGALGSVAIIETIAARARTLLSGVPLVVDPVMISKHGHSLLAPEAVESLRNLLLPLTFLVTPNAPEAEALSGVEVRSVRQAGEAAHRIAALGPRHVLVKGGHLSGAECIDVLLSDGLLHEIRGERFESKHTHGTGCTLSAAITARLAQGLGVEHAVLQARSFLAEALKSAPKIGQGIGPLGHWAQV